MPGRPGLRIMNTRSHPRTLEQAFGPYARGPIDEPKEPMPAADKIVVVGSLILAVVVVALIVAGVIQ
jgi:hypothetical protein